MVTAVARDGLGSKDFRRLAALIERLVGIKMPETKLTMLEGRLRRRVHALSLPSLDDYCRLVFDRGGLGDELVHLVDVVTTNKTDFFREPQHFTFLTETVVPELMETFGAGLSRPLRLWSSACSTGPEPYTMAMVLSEMRGPRFEIEATDICTEALAEAVRAIYPADMAAPVPEAARRAYLMRSRDPDARRVRVVPEIRRLVSFRRLNLLEDSYPWSQPMDVIFCRNVLIYFSKETQQRVLDFLCRHLRDGGYLFLGHAETLAGVSLPLRAVAPAVYRRC